MDMSLFVMLLLSGLLCSASSLWRDYYYVHQNMSWTEAQSYCRERFTDLATVDSMDDVNRMINTVNDGYSGSVWIGLKNVTKRRWIWSMGNENLTQYSSWWGTEPSGDGNCVFSVVSSWYDFSCATALSFACYDETNGFIIISALKNWKDAQSYCRQYHTDLATVHNSVENNQIYSLYNDTRWVWIGLFSDSWQWSDQWSLSFRNWAAGQPSTTGDCVAMSTTDSGKWVRCDCNQQLPFVCYGEDKVVKKQIVRLNLSHDGTYDLNDPSVQTAILNEISEKLGGYQNISWRKDEGGEVFHLSKPTVNSNT